MSNFVCLKIDNHDVISLRIYDVDPTQDVQVQDGTAAEVSQPTVDVYTSYV